MKRFELREIIMKIIYQIIIFKDCQIEYDVSELINEEIEKPDAFVTDTTNGILMHVDELKELANKYLKDWDFTRLSKVDQAILLLSIYELKYTSTPNIVVINEAVELSKKYSDEAVTKMINGVLDSIYHNEENHD